MNKRFLSVTALILVFLMISFALSGCGKKDDGIDEESPDDTETPSDGNENEVVEDRTIKTDTFRINCGGAAIEDSSGKKWTANLLREYEAGGYGGTGGIKRESEATVLNTDFQELYKTFMQSSELKYQFDSILPGKYSVKLYTAELVFEADNIDARVFNVIINEVPYAYEVCPVVQAGKDTALELEYIVEIADGESLALRLPAIRGSAALCGIEITPAAEDAVLSEAAVKEKLGLIRVNVGINSTDYIDSSGRLWLQDKEYINGEESWGYLSGFAGSVSNTHTWQGDLLDDEIYKHFRHGSPLAYRFDNMKAGTYEVHLYTGEDYFSATSKRLFDIFYFKNDESAGRTKINESLIDIYAEVGEKVKYELPVFDVTLEEGDSLTIQLIATTGVDYGLLTAIEIIPKQQ